MSDDESDAEFERRYPQKKSGMPAWAILLIVLGAVGFLGVFGLFALGMVFGAAAVAPGPQAVAMATVEPPQLRERFTRAELERAVMGKTEAEVEASLGEAPFSVGVDGDETWMYRRRTTHPVTGRTDEVVEVVFRGGKVARVDYRDEAAPGGPGPAPGK